LETNNRSGWLHLVAAGAAGGMVCLSLPPIGWWPSAWIGLAVLYHVLAGRRFLDRIWLGLLCCLGWLAPALYPLEAFNIAGYMILSAVMAAIFALVLSLTPPAAGRRLAFPALLSLASFTKDHWPLGGLPLGGIALGQAAGPLAASARIGGHLLVDFLTASLAIVVHDLYEARHQISWQLRKRLGIGLAGAGQPRAGWNRPVADLASRGLNSRSNRLAGSLARTTQAALVVGVAALSLFAPGGRPEVRTLSIDVVQGGGPRGLRAVTTDQEAPYLAVVRETELVRPPVDMVLWPENVVHTTNPPGLSATDLQIMHLAERLSTTIVAGVTQTVGRHHFVVDAVAFGPNGRVTGIYQKHHLVPFGEYVPDRPLISKIVNLADVPRNAIPGNQPPVMKIDHAKLGVMISYEVFFARRGFDATQHGADLLLVPTDTASYTTRQVPGQELAAARLQAISEGRYVVMADPTGYSAEIAPSGQVIHRTVLGQPAEFQVSAPLLDGSTWYRRGRSFLVPAGLILYALALWSARRAR
jgi:apolipoprotein N-acyltransferase